MQFTKSFVAAKRNCGLEACSLTCEKLSEQIPGKSFHWETTTWSVQSNNFEHLYPFLNLKKQLHSNHTQNKNPSPLKETVTEKIEQWTRLLLKMVINPDYFYLS